MQPKRHKLSDGRLLVIREAEAGDAVAALAYVEAISGESDYLSFGPGEFELTEAEEVEFLRKARESDNQLFLLGLVDDEIVGNVSFVPGHRPRLRHCGELGVSVRREYWGLGIGSALLDSLVEWARASEIVKKINLHVRTDNPRAIELYKRKGFVNEGTIRKGVFFDDTFYDYHNMGLEV